MKLVHPALAAACLALAALPLPAAETVTVSPGDVTDRRRNDGNFASLEVELKLGGPSAAGARGVRARVKKAVDDTGRDLMPKQPKGSDYEQAAGEGPPAVKVELRNPSRRATKLLEVSGDVDVFVPGRDPASVARSDAFQSKVDRPISSPALKSAGAEVTVVSRKTYDAEKKKEEERRKKEAESAGIAGAMASAFGGLFEGLFGDIGENDVLLRVTDPGKKLFAVDIVDAKGQPIDGMGTMKIASFWILKYPEKLPADAALRIYVLTPKAVLTTPFRLRDVALP
jgi:hypothetical protein